MNDTHKIEVATEFSFAPLWTGLVRTGLPGERLGGEGLVTTGLVGRPVDTRLALMSE